MPIENHPLTQRRLQFIGISVNKLRLKSINIIKSSNNYKIISSFICWNQNIVHMKILDTSFKLTKRRFRFNKEGSLYLACNDKNAFFTSEQPKRYKLWSCQKMCDALF